MREGIWEELCCPDRTNKLRGFFKIIYFFKKLIYPGA